MYIMLMLMIMTVMMMHNTQFTTLVSSMHMNSVCQPGKRRLFLTIITNTPSLTPTAQYESPSMLDADTERQKYTIHK